MKNSATIQGFIMERNSVMQKILEKPVTQDFYSTTENGLVDVRNKITRVSSSLTRVKAILKYSIFAQIVLSVFIVGHALINMPWSGPHWLNPDQMQDVPIILNERPIRQMKVNVELVQCAMWKVCDSHKHFQPQYVDSKSSQSPREQYASYLFSKEVMDLNRFLKENPNYAAFFAAQGISNKAEATANFYSINKLSGQKVPEPQVKQVQAQLKLGEFTPETPRPVKKHLFALICLIAVFQAYFVIKGRQAVKYTSRLEKIVANAQQQ